jgi:homoserine kinase
VAERSVSVRVPASSANLGPGFDTFAAALSPALELRVSDATEFVLTSDLRLPTDRTNLVVRAFERLLTADGLSFVISSKIPLGGGLGSSAAAIVAGLLAARTIASLDVDVLALATELEGHPDNVAAALFGGVVICADGEAQRIDPPSGLSAVLVVPREGVLTARARAALPQAVPLADAVYNTAHGALLMLGLARGDLELIARGLRDRLHEPYRAALYPRSAELAARAAELGAIGATISGAGPSVLFWVEDARVDAVSAALEVESAGWAEVLVAEFEPAGALVAQV